MHTTVHLYTCMHVCAHFYIDVYLHVYTRAYTCVMRRSIQAGAYACVHICPYTRQCTVHTRVCTRSGCRGVQMCGAARRGAVAPRGDGEGGGVTLRSDLVATPWRHRLMGEPANMLLEQRTPSERGRRGQMCAGVAFKPRPRGHADRGPSTSSGDSSSMTGRRSSGSMAGVRCTTSHMACMCTLASRDRHTCIRTCMRTCRYASLLTHTIRDVNLLSASFRSALTDVQIGLKFGRTRTRWMCKGVHCTTMRPR